MNTSSHFTLDHITVVADSLEQGAAYVREHLGVSAQLGGEHPKMGTHNLLLKLGNELFLEIIAINPQSKAPKQSRWFGLDTLKGRVPRLATWVIGTKDIQSDLTKSPLELGKATEITRGELTWKISIGNDGELILDGAYPSLIEWPTGVHPASGMKDLGCSLLSLEVHHPDAKAIQQLLNNRFFDDRVSIRPS